MFTWSTPCARSGQALVIRWTLAETSARSPKTAPSDRLLDAQATPRKCISPIRYPRREMDVQWPPGVAAAPPAYCGVSADQEARYSSNIVLFCFSPNWSALPCWFRLRHAKPRPVNAESQKDLQHDAVLA